MGDTRRQPKSLARQAGALPPAGTYVVYHGAHHDDVPSILRSGLRGDPGQPTVTDSREGAELHAAKRDWTAPKVVEIHVPHDQVSRYLDEPEGGVPIEGTIHALRETLPPQFIRAVHEAGLRREAAASAYQHPGYSIPEWHPDLAYRVIHEREWNAANERGYFGPSAETSDKGYGGWHPGTVLMAASRPVPGYAQKRGLHRVVTFNRRQHGWELGEGYREDEVRRGGEVNFVNRGHVPVSEVHSVSPPVTQPGLLNMYRDWKNRSEIRPEGAWTPQAGIFAPTTGLDHRLFDEQSRLRPEVRAVILERLDRCIRTDSGLAGSDWQGWTRVYLMGGSASEWAGDRPNDTAQDLDVIVAIDLREAQRHNAFEALSAGEAASALNAAFWKHFNADNWHAPFGGIWNLTAFCNQRAWYVEDIRPYAAWDLMHDGWAVVPPHLPEHSIADFSPEVIAHARAVAAEARAILRMDEPLRTREATALWNHVHEHRCQAFSPEGSGWDDPGNVDEKYLAYHPHRLLQKIKDLALGPRTAAGHSLRPKDEVDYRQGSNAEHCGNCVMIRDDADGGHRCTLVAGKIDPQAVCDEWSPGKTAKTGVAAASSQEYWIGHRPPGPGHTSQGGAPRASVPYHEAAGRDPGDLVDVYRAAPGHADAINPGDWVTLHGDWARERAESEPGYQVLHARVPARHVYLDAAERDDDEAGYHGPGIRAQAAAEGYLRNPYHGTPEFGGRGEWSHTWFHGTRGEPDFGTRRKYSEEAQRAALPPEQRVMNSGWTQPNQHLGVHFSPLHEVGHKFAPSTWRGPTSIAHVRLRGSNPAHFETEEHLNIAMADWASRHYPHWHNEKLNSNAAWNYSDQEGTHRDFSQVPDDPGQRWRMSQQAQSLLTFHPHMPEILAGFKAHLREQGHHGITYGNGVEGPYDTDATRGGEASMKAIRKHENWPRGAPKSISAIADPEDIEITHVEHIAPWRAEPEGNQRTWEDVSDADEPDEMRDRVLKWHREQGGRLPSRVGSRDKQLAAMDPLTRASALAQEAVRSRHPLVTRPLHVRDGESSVVLSTWLARHGHPLARTAYITGQPGTDYSCTGRGPDGEPAVMLHDDRRDYGTLAHEAAHLIDDHETGRAHRAPHGPDGAHSDAWARHYATLLNSLSAGAGDEFLAEREYELSAMRHEGTAGMNLGRHLEEMHGWIVHPQHDLAHEHAWDHRHGNPEVPHSHAPGQADHPLADAEPPAHSEVLRSLPHNEHDMPVSEALRLRSGDWGGAVGEHLDDIREKIGEDYEDAGAGLREIMSSGVQPGGPLVVNGGQLDDGHRRLWMAHHLGWPSVRVRQGAWGPHMAAAEPEYSHRTASAEPGTSQRPKRTPGSAMVYLEVPHGVVQQHEGQEAGHHIALAYLPRKIGDEAFGRVVDRARETAARHAPMKATISGGMIFPPGTPPDRRRASVVPVHAPGIHELHAEFADFDRAHYEAYTPHVTRAQLGGHQADPDPHPEVSFPVTYLHVRRGDEVHSFPLTGPNRMEAAVDRGANWVDDARKTISDMAAAKGHSLTWTADEIDERRPHRMYWWRASCDNCGEPSGKERKALMLPQDPAENADHWLGDNEHLPHWVKVKCSQGRPRRYGPQPVPVPRTPPPAGWPRQAAARGPWYHGTAAELQPGDLIEPGKYPRSHQPYQGVDESTRDHTYFSSDLPYVTEYYGPNMYEVEPLGGHSRDPEYSSPKMRRSKEPLRVVRKVHERWGIPIEKQAVSGYDGLTGRTAMIYLELPPGTVRPVPGGVDDHHITLVYLGKNVSDEKWAEACRRAEEAAAQCPPMEGVLRGIDIFPPSKSSDGKVPAFVPAYVGGIGRLRRLLEDLSASEHKDFRPHVSLAYLEEGDSLPAPHPAVPLRFTHLCVKRGDDVVRFPLTGP